MEFEQWESEEHLSSSRHCSYADDGSRGSGQWDLGASLISKRNQFPISIGSLKGGAKTNVDRSSVSAARKRPSWIVGWPERQPKVGKAALVRRVWQCNHRRPA